MKRKRIRSGLLSLTDILFNILIDFLFDGLGLFILGALVIWLNGWDKIFYLIAFGVVLSIIILGELLGWLSYKFLCMLFKRLHIDWYSIFPWLKETSLTNDESKQQIGQ